MTRRMSYGERLDANCSDIADNLRRRGVTVAHIKASHANSVGVADLVCGYRGRCHLLEIKVLGAKLETTQVAFSRVWTGCYHVATNSLEAFNDISRCTNVSSGVSIPIDLIPAGSR